jgi:CRISPR-associated protein Csb2
VAVSLTVELLSGRYDAAEVDDRERSEWPPHPARLFCALVAAARTDADRAALQWLETQPAPLVVAAGAPQETRRASYVVVNAVEKKGGNLTHPGRTNNLRARMSAVPASPRVTTIWSGDPAPEVVEALDAMARRIPYLGRSTGVALVAAAVAPDAAPTALVGSGQVVYEPCDLLEREVSVRIPYPGFLAELDVQFAADRPAWEVSRFQGYRQRQDIAPSAVEDELVPSVYTDLVMFRFSGLRPQARLTVQFTDALRSAVLRIAGRAAPEVLHGHGADGRPHVAFLALPDVGSDHSDGHLLGMAVAVPELPENERAAVLRAVLGLRTEGLDGVVEIAVPGIGGVELLYQPGLVRPWGASPERWRRGSRHWVSATPVVLDRYPKRPEQVEDEVRGCLRRVGLPEPVDVRISKESMLTGAARLRPADLPQRVRGRQYRHVAVTFDRRVAGPVLVGAGRYLGVGLLAPAPGRGADA